MVLKEICHPGCYAILRQKQIQVGSSIPSFTFNF